MPQRLFANAVASSTCASAINNSQTTITLQSTAAFSVPAANQQFSATILDTGNPAYSANNPLATPYEYVFCTGNNTGTNTLTVQRGQGGTTAKAFFAGATVSQTFLAEDVNASFPRQIDTVVTTASQTSVRLPRSGSMPQNFSLLKIKWFGQSDQGTPQRLQININNDTTSGHYFSNQADFTDASASYAGQLGTANGLAGGLPATATLNTGVGEITIVGYSQTTFRVTWQFTCWRTDGGASGNPHAQIGGGVWAASPLAVVTDIELTCAAGGFVAGSTFVLYGEP